MAAPRALRLPTPTIADRFNTILADACHWLDSGTANQLASARAGAGKSALIVGLAEHAHRTGRRLVVAATTNMQVRDLTERIAQAGVDVIHLHAVGENGIHPRIVAVPAPGGGAANAFATMNAGRGAHVLTATLWQLGSAGAAGLVVGDADGVVDEAFQARSESTNLAAMQVVDGLWLYVGDPAQIEPFSGLDRNPFAHHRNDPVASLVASSIAAGGLDPATAWEMPWSRRLPHSAAWWLDDLYEPGGLVQATAAGRSMRLTRRAVTGGPEAMAVCSAAARTGWAMMEVPGLPLATADPVVAEHIAQVVAQLLASRPEVTCERRAPAVLQPERVAVITPNTAQIGMVAAALARHGVTGVRVDTANRHQGLEYDVAVAWHPLSAAVDADEFSMGLGRLCVMTTRHRHACILVGRAGVRALLDDPPLSTLMPGAGGRDPILAGWLAHRQLLDHLDTLGVVSVA